MLKIFRKKPGEPPPVAVAGDLRLHRPWARLGTGGEDLVGGYLTIVNTGGERDRLLSASSPAAGVVEIHAIRVIGPAMRMRPLADGLALPADTTIELRPRGYHLQFRELRDRVVVGTRLPVALVFERAGTVDLSLEVTDRGPVGGDTLIEVPQRG